MNNTLKTELVELIITGREFCTNDENTNIRDWAFENGVKLTRGQVRSAKSEATETINSSSAVNHIYYG